MYNTSRAGDVEWTQALSSGIDFCMLTILFFEISWKLCTQVLVLWIWEEEQVLKIPEKSCFINAETSLQYSFYFVLLLHWPN